MIILLGDNDVKEMIARQFGVSVDQVVLDNDNRFSLEVENVLVTKKMMPNG